MIYKNEVFEEERALYGASNIALEGCAFEGAADGESALKESEGVYAVHTRFALRYPLWHARCVRLEGCEMTEGCRAPLWYAEDVTLKDTEIRGVKVVRECRAVSLLNTRTESAEFGWFSSGIRIKGGSLSGEYAFLNSSCIEIEELSFSGKYSFQYTRDVVIKNAVLKTKDAFWHAKNITVYDSLIEGEYLGWYSENLRLVRCTLRGTQPLCYARGLVLEDCRMENADLAFEKSEVTATVIGKIDSVKAIAAGTVVCDECGAVLPENDGSEGEGKLLLRSEVLHK